MNYNRFPSGLNPIIPGYIQPIFASNGIQPNFQTLSMTRALNTFPQQQTSGYNLNYSWPAPKSTEVFNHQMVSPFSSNWAPALPISNFSKKSESNEQEILINMNPDSHKRSAVWPINEKNTANLPLSEAESKANE